MEKDSERNISISGEKGQIGEVRIADDVVASMAGNATDELLSRVGVRGTNKGAKVEVVDRVVSVEMAVNLKYGFNIPTVSEKIQEKVKSAIETMTGLTVADVNIRIAGVVMNG